jgi:DNA-directed RNA polymerase subunit RPC12/RpoP
MQSSGAQATRNCVSCGRSISWDANVCPYCGHDFRTTMAGVPQQKKESAMPLVGGILIILASLGYFGVGGIIAGGSAFWVDVGGGAGVLCGVVLIILGIISLLGGIFAIQRKNFAIALIGGIFVVPSILGLIGLILVAVAKDEFTS